MKPPKKKEGSRKGVERIRHFEETLTIIRKGEREGGAPERGGTFGAEGI